MNEWSLIIFTLLTQFAVGVFIVTGIVERQQQRVSIQNSVFSTNPILLTTVGVALVALLASFLHLGSPANALHALNNLATSWLSREILFVSLFTGGAVLLLILNFTSTGSGSLRKLVAYITALSGILAVFSMAKVYMLETVPVWNTFLTPVQFFLTAFLLGGLGVMLFKGEMDTSIVRGSLKAVFVLVLASMIVWIASVYLFMNGGMAGRASLEIILAENGWLFYGRILLLAVSVLLLVYSILRQTAQGKSGILVAVFFILIIAEIVGRYLFYAAYVRVGV